MYWSSRNRDIRYGEIYWDEQFAFRGKVVVCWSSVVSGVARVRVGAVEEPHAMECHQRPCLREQCPVAAVGVDVDFLVHAQRVRRDIVIVG